MCVCIIISTDHIQRNLTCSPIAKHDGICAHTHIHDMCIQILASSAYEHPLQNLLVAWLRLTISVGPSIIIFLFHDCLKSWTVSLETLWFDACTYTKCKLACCNVATPLSHPPRAALMHWRMRLRPTPLLQASLVLSLPLWRYVVTTALVHITLHTALWWHDI